MTRSLFRVAGGAVHDPARGIDGAIEDLWIEEGRFVAPPGPGEVVDTRTIDARGLTLMPGGIDLHCHIVGHKVNAARRMTPGSNAAPSPVPSTALTGHQYLGMGYTTAFDAAVSPLLARQAHHELADTPGIDKGFFALVGDHAYALRAIRDRDPARLIAFLGWLIDATGAYAAKLVNPGGAAAWKHVPTGRIAGLDEKVSGIDVAPRDILRELAAAVDALGLPHPLHIHANQLGLPGNWRTTLASMQALEGRRGHFTHIQFHSYAGHGESEAGFDSGVQPLVDYVNSHPEITVDVGQVLFGPTMSMTGDSALGHYLAELTGGKWYSQDLELEGGCGVSPIRYREKNLVHAWQWAIGLEWFLLMKNPWQIALSTDHPNGAAFQAYPQLIRLLMDRGYRREMLARVHAKVQQKSLLRELDREYTLHEIAIITRAAPARMLGLSRKGHLGPGGDADIVAYLPHANREEMFRCPKYVFRAGELWIDDGQPRFRHFGKLIRAEVTFDRGIESHLESWWNDHATVEFAGFPVRDLGINTI